MGVSRINWIYKKPSRKDTSLCSGDDNILVNTFNKLKPEVYTTYDWHMFSSLKRYLFVMFYVYFILAVDTLNFLMKYQLWIPFSSDILKFRVLLWGLCAIVSSKEYFEYLDDPNCQRIGPFFWLTTFTLNIETLIFLKTSYKLFLDVGFPWYVQLIFLVYLVLFIGGALYAASNGIDEPSRNDKV